MTRPAAHGLGLPLDEVGLITLDAHFDMRETDDGPMNGNPVRCLLEDGLPGATSARSASPPSPTPEDARRRAAPPGIGICDIEQVLDEGIEAAIDDALEQLSHVEAILVDFDIDVIDRAQLPGAPGARPGGLPASEFFRAARRLAEEDGSAWSTSPSSIPASTSPTSARLTAGRWVCEILAGYQMRGA